MNLNVATVAGIITICYLIGLIAKQVDALDNKWIPVIVGISGGLLGVAGMQVMAGFPADNIIDAISVGIASGLASTGVNQIYKQLNEEH